MQAEASMKAAEQVLKGIHLPPCPTTLLAVMKEAGSDDADLGKIARLIIQDIGLSAPMLKMANSPYFGLRNKVSSIQQAVSVLGTRNTVNLLSNVALRANVVPNVPNLNEFWDRSSLTALAASHIAAQIPGMSRDDAYTVGLFHDCGIPVLMQKYPGYAEKIGEMARISGSICQAENDSYSTTHAVVGNLLARNWLLPPQMCRAILFHHDLTIYTPGGDPDSIEICNWISMIHAAEYIVDSYLNLNNDSWETWQPKVLKQLQFTEREFVDLRSDVVNMLDGD